MKETGEENTLVTPSVEVNESWDLKSYKSKIESNKFFESKVTKGESKFI